MKQRSSLVWMCVGFLALAAGCSRVPSKDEETGNRILRNAAPLIDRGQLAAARDSALKALEVFRVAASDDGMGTAEQMLGDIETSEAAYDKALEYYASATGHFRTSGDKISARAVTLSLMELSTRMGLEEESLKRGDEALRLAQLSEDRESILELGAALLPLARTLGRRDVEDQVLGEAAHDADSTGDVRRQAWVKDQEGLSAFFRGDAPAAVRWFMEGRDLAQRVGDTLTAVPILLHLGRAYESNADLPDAIATYAAALSLGSHAPLDPGVQREIQFRTGNALLGAKHNAEAVGYFQSALALSKEHGDEIARRYALLQMTNALRTINLQAALPIIHEALDGLENSAPPSLVAYAFGTEGLCLLAANQPVDALASFQHAAASTELEWSHSGDDLYADCRRTVVGAGRTPWHDEEIDLLTRMGRNEDALTVALQRSAWLLYRDLDRVRPAVGDTTLQAMLDRWHALRARCNGAEEELRRSWSSSAGAREQAAAVTRVLAQASADARALSSDIISARRSLCCFVSPQCPSATEIRRMLPDGTVMLLYVSTSRTLVSFVVGRQALSVHTVAIPRAQLAARCTDFSNELRRVGGKLDSLTEFKPKQLAQALTDQGSALYELFVRPAERDLNQARALLIAEANEIPFIPVSMVRRSGTAGTSLLERIPVAYIFPSLLHGENFNDPIINHVIAFGSSGFSGRDAEYELRDIKVTFKDAEFHFDPNAKLAELATEHADLAHLALDVHWDGTRPANSFVAMLDPATRVIKQRPIGDLCAIPVYPAVTLYNLSSDASEASGRIAAIPFSTGSRIVVANCTGTGRKSTKNFVDAFSNELRAAKGASEAYRSALLAIIRRPDAIPAFWMPFVLWIDP